MNEERICMDCGVVVVFRGTRSDGTIRWGAPKGPSVWGGTCRSELDGEQLVSADYHYVKGEVQRTYRRDPSG